MIFDQIWIVTPVNRPHSNHGSDDQCPCPVWTSVRRPLNLLVRNHHPPLWPAPTRLPDRLHLCASDCRLYLSCSTHHCQWSVEEFTWGQHWSSSQESYPRWGRGLLHRHLPQHLHGQISRCSARFHLLYHFTVTPGKYNQTLKYDMEILTQNMIAPKITLSRQAQTLEIIYENHSNSKGETKILLMSLCVWAFCFLIWYSKL